MADRTYELIKFSPKRTFGVELEFGRESSREFLRDCVISAGESALTSEWAHNSGNSDWICKTDSSCGFEIASRVLGSIRSIRKTVKDLSVMEKVVSVLREKGAKITVACGIHVHVWIGDLSKQDVEKLLYYWVKFEKTLMDMMPASRKKNRFCPAPSGFLNPDEKLSYNDINSKAYHSRGTLNMGWYRDRQTIEIRLAEGSTDPIMVKNWVRFLLHFVEKVASFPEAKDVNWLTLEECLDLLDLSNDPESGKFRILSPALAELRSWILRRTNEHAGYRDADVVKQKTKEMLTVVG